jgi:predicted CopG family antitoxin
VDFGLYKTKNVKLSEDVHRELGEMGKLSESYNDVIRRLIDHYKKTKGKSAPKSSDQRDDK